MNKKYDYRYWLTQLSDGGFNDIDKPLGKLLKEGWKPLRETPVGNGFILLVLSKALEDDVV